LNTEAIYHHPFGAYAYTNGLDTMRVRLRTSSRDTVECFVRWNDRCSSQDCVERVTPMTWLADDGVFNYWEAELHEPNRRLRITTASLRDPSRDASPSAPRGCAAGTPRCPRFTPRPA